MYNIGAAPALAPGQLNQQLQQWALQLYRVGFPLPAVSDVGVYALAQIGLESTYGTSNLARTDNNYTGIKWVNKPYQVATRGIKSPEGDYYAHFKDFPEFARDYKRVLSLDLAGKGKPIDAKTPVDFVARLKANRYFTAPNYPAVFAGHLKKVNEALQMGQASNMFDQAKKPVKSKYGQAVLPSGNNQVVNVPEDTANPSIRYRNPNAKPGFFEGLQAWATANPLLAGVAAAGSLFVASAILSRD